jgi:hypothetical protein
MTRTKVLLLTLSTALVTSALTLAIQREMRETRRVPQFENHYVKVWKSIILPNQPLTLHRHEHGRALIALKGGSLDVVNADGEVVDTYVWEDGKAYWLDKDPPDVLHGDLNRGPGNIEVIVVELQNE